MNNRTKELSKEWPIIFVVGETVVCDLLGWPHEQAIFLPVETMGEFQDGTIMIVVVDVMAFNKKYHVMFKSDDSDLALVFKLINPCERADAPISV